MVLWCPSGCRTCRHVINIHDVNAAADFIKHFGFFVSFVFCHRVIKEPQQTIVHLLRAKGSNCMCKWLVVKPLYLLTWRVICCELLRCHSAIIFQDMTICWILNVYIILHIMCNSVDILMMRKSSSMFGFSILAICCILLI